MANSSQFTRMMRLPDAPDYADYADLSEPRADLTARRRHREFSLGTAAREAPGASRASVPNQEGDRTGREAAGDALGAIRVIGVICVLLLPFRRCRWPLDVAETMSPDPTDDVPTTS